MAEVLKRFKAQSTSNDQSKIYLIDKNEQQTLVYTGGYCSPNEELNRALRVSEQELAAFHKLGFMLKYHAA